MYRDSQERREADFPTPRTHSPSRRDASQPSLDSYYSLAAQRHTLSRLQNFFASHRFDTEGPYDDLFVVLLSTARHLVDVCNAQATHMEKQSAALASLQDALERRGRQSPTMLAVNVEGDAVESRLDVFETRLDNLTRQCVRLEARQDLARVADASSSMHEGASAVAADVIHDEEAHKWRVQERLDAMADTQESAIHELQRALRQNSSATKRLHDDQRVHAAWCSGHIASIEAQLEAVSRAGAESVKRISPETATIGAQSTTPKASADIVTTAKAIASWREQKNAHPLLHPAVLARLFGDDAAAVQFTESIQDRLNALEAHARDSGGRLAAFEAQLEELHHGHAARANQLEARLSSSEDIVQELAGHLATLSRAFEAFAARASAPSVARGDETYLSVSSANVSTRDALQPPTRHEQSLKSEIQPCGERPSAPLRTAHPYSLAPHHQTAPQEAVQIAPSPASHMASRTPTDLYPAHDDDVSAPQFMSKAKTTHEEHDKQEVPQDRSAWAALKDWLQQTASSPSPAAPASEAMHDASAKAAWQQLRDAIRCVITELQQAPLDDAQTHDMRASPPSAHASILGEMDSFRSSLAAVTDGLNTIDARLGVLETYSPHMYAVATRPPVLGVELEDVPAHPEEVFRFPEGLGGGGGGGGVRVVRVFAGYPASYAGFAAGDVVVAVKGHTVHSRAELFACLTALATEHSAECRVRLEDGFLRSQGICDAGVDLECSKTGARRAESTRAAPAVLSRAGQIQSLLPRHEIPFILWRQGEFVEVCLLVPPSW